MNLSELTVGKLHLNLSLIFSVTGLLIAIFFAVAIDVWGAGPFGVGPTLVQAASESFQDELQLKLSSNGFTPAEAQRSAGTVAIAVENSAMSGEYTLQLKAQDGTVLKEVQVQQGSAAWTMTLAAGEYRLAETTHPEWSCRITVQ